MKNTHKPLIIGNWKMNPATITLAKKLFAEIKTGLGRKRLAVDVAVAPPFPYLSDINKMSAGKYALAAQDVFFAESGAHTGEVSLSMLKSVGVSAVIVGHSERRAQGESDHELYQDLLAVFKSKVTAVVCVGESTRDANGNFFSVVEAQLRSALRAVPKTKLNQLVIAYEPVWAIGTGKHATAEDVLEMKLFIQKILTDHVGRTRAARVRIVYGGSVKPKNAEVLLTEGGVDGFLIGGASLKAKDFVSVIKTAHQHVTTAV